MSVARGKQGGKKRKHIQPTKLTLSNQAIDGDNILITVALHVIKQLNPDIHTFVVCIYSTYMWGCIWIYGHKKCEGLIVL